MTPGSGRGGHCVAGQENTYAVGRHACGVVTAHDEGVPAPACSRVNRFQLRTGMSISSPFPLYMAAAAPSAGRKKKKQHKRRKHTGQAASPSTRTAAARVVPPARARPSPPTPVKIKGHLGHGLGTRLAHAAAASADRGARRNAQRLFAVPTRVRAAVAVGWIPHGPPRINEARPPPLAAAAQGRERAHLRRRQPPARSRDGRAAGATGCRRSTTAGGGARRGRKGASAPAVGGGGVRQQRGRRCEPLCCVGGWWRGERARPRWRRDHHRGSRQ